MSTTRAAGRRWLGCACVLILAAAGGAPARAQVAGVEGFRLDTLILAPTPEDGLVLETPHTLEHLQWSAQIALDYAREPLVSEGTDGVDPDEVDIVANRISAQAVVALGLGERGEIFLRVPATLFQNGDEPPSDGFRYPVPASGGFGDISLGGSVRMFGGEKGFSAGAHGSLWLPSGSRDSLSGDRNVGVRAGFSLMYKDRATALAFESGAHYRPESDYGTIVSGTQWYYRAGLHVWLKPEWRLLMEVDAAMRVSSGQAFETDNNSAEALVAARYGEGDGLYATLGVGLGLLSMAGTPMVRGVFGVGWASQPRPP